ncbi:hypothetical protein ES708_11646 [subsurface metagenome]|jgi:hypothetical protein
MKYHVVVSVDLEYIFDVSSKGEALVKAESVELPKNCVENSFKIIELESYEDFEEF